jgi:hypothetical protein
MYWKKGIAVDGRIEWQEITEEEHEAIEDSDEIDNWAITNPLRKCSEVFSMNPILKRPSN